MKLGLSLIIICVSLVSLSQKKVNEIKNLYSEVDNIINSKNDSLTSLNILSSYINSKFTKEEDKSRAIFYWITKNISYSSELMFSYKTNTNRSSLVKEVFENRTGVCIGYAVLVDTLCKLTNLNSYIIEGSTKQSFLPSIIGHAWNGIKINGEWKLIDATWGSGYLQGKKFISKLNNFYFLPNPDKLISTHISIDPIWQMLKRPITLYQFYSNRASIVTNDWNWQDSISLYLNSDYISKISSTIRRLNEFGTTNEISSNYYQYLKSLEGNFYVKKINQSTNYLNEGIAQYNDYINFKNKQFKPIKSDEEISKLLPKITIQINKSKQEMVEIPEEYLLTNKEFVLNNNKLASDLDLKVKDETIFVEKYLTTKKNKRNDLFFIKKYTVFGVPVK